MRTVGGNRDFFDWLITLGDGKFKNVHKAIDIPSKFAIKDSLIDFVYRKKIHFKRRHFIIGWSNLKP